MINLRFKLLNIKDQINSGSRTTQNNDKQINLNNQQNNNEKTKLNDQPSKFTVEASNHMNNKKMYSNNNKKMFSNNKTIPLRSESEQLWTEHSHIYQSGLFC